MDLDWKKNLGNTDRMIRTAIGLLLLGLAYTKTITGWWATASIIIAMVQFIDALFAY